jgi:hypothetical protein
MMKTRQDSCHLMPVFGLYVLLGNGFPPEAERHVGRGCHFRPFYHCAEVEPETIRLAGGERWQGIPDASKLMTVLPGM